MNFVKYLLLLSICFCSFTQAAELNKKEMSALSQKADVIIKAMLDKQATEYKAARVYKHLTNIRFSDFDVVMFTIEGFTGGNNSQFYMALFGPSSERFRFIDVIEVGAHGWRYVDFNSVISSNNNIEIDTREYQGTDSHCCPSKNGKVRFVLTDQDRLIEVEKINVGENR